MRRFQRVERLVERRASARPFQLEFAAIESVSLVSLFVGTALSADVPSAEHDQFRLERTRIEIDNEVQVSRRVP